MNDPPLMPPSPSGDVLEMWTIYDNPDDHPGKFVVRRIWIRGGEFLSDPAPIYVVDTLSEARRSVPGRCDTCLHRSPDDVPSIVETWI